MHRYEQTFNGVPLYFLENCKLNILKCIHLCHEYFEWLSNVHFIIDHRNNSVSFA